ncbi:MAG TPA: urea carboxylase-associated family protein [Candidatus Binatia bacterium]|nr:urea carboxylase-associated family protein [Candidatus Binatia bacterium]
MAVLQRTVVPKNSGAAFELKKGQRLRIAGRSIVDFVAFNLNDLTERFDQARTKTNQVKIFISTGDILYSKRNNPMLTIVEDTFKEGRHDLQKGMCSRQRFQMVAEGRSKRVFAEGVDINPKKADEIPDHGCWENLSGALKPWNISPDDVPSPFNVFQCMRIDSDTGIMYDTMIRPKNEALVDLRAEMDLLVAASACPESGRGQAIRVEIYDD